ncbi:ATP-binding protein [Aliiglaciecola sp. CAU 1673]|uniref:sensor histidine kinase n=1 Tax=Aliiglaciecola sp. CAU 1673 TaxID=3032595 RepID=UPI0023DAA0A6|nr:ATP-binding protein [Aliiglaciecola sp. CAU 1673]MDF2177684.1 ATP-binding protein [Aliiglaciecola sp. CAU 1673]
MKKHRWQMNIKTRILVFIVLFEIIAYSTLQLVNHYLYVQELDALRQSQIQSVLQASVVKIENARQRMEQKATALAIAGERLFALRQNQHLSTEQATAHVKDLLKDNFASFEQALGGGIWYEPYAFDPEIRYYGPYVFRQLGDMVFSWDLSSQEYDYHQQDWYRLAVNSGWGTRQKSFRPLLWTAPYVDDAGSLSPMMTVDSVMFDSGRKPIGMATVDWSLDELTRFLDAVKVTTNAFPFFVHRDSGLVLSYPMDPSRVMTQAYQLPVINKLLEDTQTGVIKKKSDVQVSEIPYELYYFFTEDGFLFGSLVPVADLRSDIKSISDLILLYGAQIALAFILLMIVVLNLLFRPFDAVLKTIRESVSYEDEDSKVVLKPIEYHSRNEFSPIVKAMNDVYLQVREYVQQVEETNQKLRASKQQISQLNAELERKVEVRTAELEQKTRLLSDSLERLKRTQQQLIQNEKHAALGRLVAGVAHQINTPLGICVTAASLLSNELHNTYSKALDGQIGKKAFGEACDKMVECADMLQLNLDRASNLISSFKQVAVDQSSENKRRFNVAEYINKILLSMRSKFENTPHKIELTCDPKLSLYSHPGALTQILTNLIDNALTHAFDADNAGKIEIKVEQSEDQLRILVADNGKGMPEDIRELVFDPFFTTKHEQLSSGLGLHLVYNIVVQQLSGSIECQSQLGVGTKFIIIIPLQEEVAQPQSTTN